MKHLKNSKGRFIGAEGGEILRKHPRFYGVWANMKERCDNPKYKSYANYGGRGIKYEPRWTDINEFYKDMFPKYRRGLTLDREDNNGNYTPDNCRWVSQRVQQNNRRNNHYITHQGKTQSAADWAREIGVNANTLWTRIMVYGWPIEKALTNQTFKGQKTNGGRLF